MSGSSTPDLTSVAEVGIDFGGFKNIDLFSQGIYQLRVRATTECSKRQCPPSTFETVRQGRAPPPPTDGSFLPAHVLEESGDFCLPSFRVRFCDEEVRLTTTARFRAELSVDSNPRLRGADDGCAVPLEPVLLEVRLMHARSNSVFDAAGDAAAQSRASFKQYAQQTLRLQLPLRGATAFFPITFDEWHFCFAPLLVHAAVVGPPKLLLPESPRNPPSPRGRASLLPARSSRATAPPPPLLVPPAPGRAASSFLRRRAARQQLAAGSPQAALAQLLALAQSAPQPLLAGELRASAAVMCAPLPTRQPPRQRPPRATLAQRPSQRSSPPHRPGPSRLTALALRRAAPAGGARSRR